MNLAQFLKWKSVAITGGEAKLLIISGQVSVNGQVDTRRGRRLSAGDHVTVGNGSFIVSESDM